MGTVAELQSHLQIQIQVQKEIQRQIQKRNIELLAVRGQWSSCPVLVESSQKRFLTFPPLLQPTGFAEFDCTCNYSEFEFISSSSNTNTKEVFDLWFAFATSRLCGFSWIVSILFSDSVQTWNSWTIGYRHWHGQGEEGKVSFLTSVSRPVNIGAAALSVNRPCQCCVGVDNGNDDIGSDQGNCPFYFPDCVVTTTTTMT